MVGLVCASSAAAQNCDCACPEGYGVATSEITYTYTNVNASGCTTEHDAKVTLCGSVCNGGAFEYNIEQSGTCQNLLGSTGILEFTISADGSTWTINGTQYPGPPGTTTADCDSISYSFSDTNPNVSTSFTITIDRGPCEPLQNASKVCGGAHGDGESCPEEPDTATSSDKSVSFLTGHKLERSVDLTVPLPGRDFELAREYTSDPNFYGTGPNYYWYNEYCDVVPGPVGVNWTMNVFQRLFGDHEEGSDVLRLAGNPVRTTREFERHSGITSTTRFVPKSNSNEYISPETVDHPQFGSDVRVYRLRTPGGQEYDFARRPENFPDEMNGLDIEDVVGQLLFERDAYGNEWCYKYELLIDLDTVNGYDPAVLKSIELNWKTGTGSNPDTWDARVYFLWNGQSGTDYAGIAQWDDANSNGIWDTTEDAVHHFGRLAEVQVVRPSGSSEIVVQKVRYLYFDDIADLVEVECSLGELNDGRYDANPGDLCEVIASERVDFDPEILPYTPPAPAINDDFYERVTQYRYYNGYDNYALGPTGAADRIEFNGAKHQLLAVFYPEQIEFFADHYGRLAVEDDTFGGGFTGFSSTTEAAARLRWVSFWNGPGSLGSASCIGEDWEDYFLPNDQWQTLYDVASKVIAYDTSSDGGNRVRTQIVNAGDGGGCGCGGSGVGGARLGTRYDYIYKRYDWGTVPDGVPDPSSSPFAVGSDGFSCIVVESHVTVDGSPLQIGYAPYRLESHDFVWPTTALPDDLKQARFAGVAWKVSFTEAEADPAWNFDPNYNPIATANPTNGTGRRWIKLFDYSSDGVQPTGQSLFNNFRRVTRVVTPSASEWDEYLPARPVSPGSSTAIAPVLATVREESGLVYGQAFTGGWKSHTTFSEGDNTSGVTPVTLQYSSTRPDLVTQIQRSPGQGPTDDTPVETTTISYGFHVNDGLSSIVAWEKRSVASESTTQNGPDTPTTFSSFRMFDTLGQLRWEQDEHGTLTYREYDETTGSLVLIVRDADPSGAYVDADADLPADFPTLSSAGFTAPSGPFEELTDLYVPDLLGRTVQHTDPSGVSRYIRFEVRPTNMVDEDGTLVSRGVPYLAHISLPHKFGSEFDGPAVISWINAGGKPVRTSMYVPDSSGAYPPTSGAFAPPTEVARSDEERVVSGATIRSREWHTIATATTASGNRPFINNESYVTSYEYDAIGRMTLVVDPEFGASEYVYDVLDRVTQISTGMASWDSYGVLSTASLQTALSVYDSPQSTVPGVGNGNLTYSELYDGVGTRVTKHWYDFRDRRVGTQNPLAPHTSLGYDDLNRVVEQASFTEATDFLSGGTVPAPSSNSDRSTYSQTLYNNRGMVYRTRLLIDPALPPPTSPDPDTRAYLESNRWYDAYGLTVASWDPNGSSTKTVYDALHRPTVVYTTDRNGDAIPGEVGNYADATSLEDDRIVEQTEYAYIAANPTTPVRGTGQAEQVTHRMRLHDATTVLPLTTATSVSTYTVYEFDDASRAVRTHAYGTNDPSNDLFVANTSPPMRPSAGQGVTPGSLMSEIFFDLWGRVVLSVSPGGKRTLTVLDPLSRQIAVVEAQANVTAAHIEPASGTWDVDWSAAYSGGGPDDADRVTTFFYDGLGNVSNRTAHLPDGSVQETVYEYGTTAVSTPSSDTDSLVSSSRLLREVRYPNESTGLAGTTAAYKVTYGYNRLGELRGMADQNGTTHAYARDSLGRVTSDTATVFGTNIDSAIKEIETAYDAHGRVASVLSLDASSVVKNSVAFDYTKLHQIKTLTQNASGDTSGPAAEVVTYTYADAAPAANSTGNYSRLASITYPKDHGGSPTVEYGYGSAGSIDDRIGRTAGIDVPGWVSGNANLVDYTYLGASTPVRVNYPATTYGLGLDMVKAQSGASAAGTYYGFDRFGRTVWHGWVTDGFTTGAGSLPDRTPLFARAYEYDMDSNRVLDYDARPGAAGTIRADRDWSYEYDPLDRLKQADRGRESGGFTLAVNSQQWQLDILGNWEVFGTDANGNGTFENTVAERQNRTHNYANEITLQERPSGMGSQIITQPAYDDAGNYLRNLNSTSARLTYKHDAWNRLVKIYKSSNESTGAVVLENQFNGLNWRVKRRMDLSQGAYNGVDEARTYYYSANWQVLEEHVDTNLTVDGDDDLGNTEDDINRIGQQFWGVRYIDDAVGRRVFRDTDNNGLIGTGDAGPSGFYYLTDVMFSVRAITDSAGLLHTRLDYTPYGVAMHGLAADVNGDGSVNTADLGVVSANYNGGNELQPGDTGYDPDAFLDGSDTIVLSDFTGRYSPYVSGGSGPTFNAGWIDNPEDPNGPDNSVGYDGYWFDLAGATEATSTGLYMVRHRVYDPKLGRWLQRDPLPSMRTDSAAARLGFVPSRKAMSVGEISQLYLYARSAPGVYADPMGLCADRIDQVLRKMADVLRKYAGLTNSLPDTGLLPDWLDGGKQFYKQNPKQHCVWNCRMTKRRGAGFAEKESDKKEALDIAMCELLLELGECASLLPRVTREFLEAHCQSATQPSDYLDNAAGRRCGCDAGLLAKYDSCEDCCDKEFGINADTDEGPDTKRPFGPWWDNGRPNRPF
tara:strand:+ start:9332 stop:17044 length:7713 start_codon:yes stop_codon:yes gene_type:complete